MDLGNDGERITAEAKVWSYYAHLSIYRFALPFLAGRSTYEAGSGAGYGTAYLAENGVPVVRASDYDPMAVEHCRRTYPGIEFEVQDLCKPLPIESGSLGGIFSSNVMEHLPDIDAFMEECRRVLQDDGVMVFAVPPITSPELLRLNVENVFHITHITPAGWHTKAMRYFEHVRCFIHRPMDQSLSMREVSLPAEQTTIRETDFFFPEVTVAEADGARSITSVFVATKPRPASLPRGAGEDLPYDWHWGSVVANVIRTERDRNGSRLGGASEADILRGQVGDLQNQLALKEATLAKQEATITHQQLEIAKRDEEIAALRGSTSWRLTRPLRALKGG